MIIFLFVWVNVRELEYASGFVVKHVKLIHSFENFEIILKRDFFAELKLEISHKEIF